MISFKNVKLTIKKFLGGYESLLKKTAKVKTGALKASISVRSSRLKTNISMLEYGIKSTSWKDSTPPFQKLKNETKKYSKNLMLAFRKDIKLQIKIDK